MTELLWAGFLTYHQAGLKRFEVVHSVDIDTELFADEKAELSLHCVPQYTK